MNTAYMCKDCCEVNLNLGLYDNCETCGSHKVFEVEAYMLNGELLIKGDRYFDSAKLEYELDKFPKNNLDEYLHIRARARKFEEIFERSSAFNDIHDMMAEMK